MQEGFLAQVGVGDRDTLPTVLVDQVVYHNWLRGEFGSPDVPQARQLGRNLLRAQTFTKAGGRRRPRQRGAGGAEEADFAAVAGQVGDRYSYFQGKSGSRDRGRGARPDPGRVHRAVPAARKVLVLVAMLICGCW